MGLTKADIRKADKRRKYSDGRGLFLSVSANGTKTWAFCYTINGLAREMGLGSIEGIELEDARERVAELRKQVRSGVDPLGDRKKEQRAVVQRKRVGSTFREVAERFIEKKRPGWTTNGRSEEAWESSLRNNAYDAIGDRDVADVTMFDIRDLLLPIWVRTNVLAQRVQNRIENIMDFAAVEGLRPDENPARKNKLLMMLPDAVHEVEHQKAMSYADIPGFVATLQEEQGIAPRALEFTILTGLRTGDIIGATWEEIDLEAKVWTIPAIRMKRKKGKTKPEDHRVPLTSRMIEILEALPAEDGNPFVFISRRKKGAALSNMAMLKLLQKDMGHDATVHGFRSAFRDWAAEETDHPDFVAEKALAHAITNKVEAAYRRGDLFEKRKALMADWTAFCTGVGDAA